jgi:transcriptional regulator with XRE-family HTH domain
MNILSIHGRVRRARKQADLTLKQVSDRLKGYNIDQLGRLERGQWQNPPLDLIVQLSHIYAVSVDWLQFGTDEGLSILHEPPAEYRTKRPIYDELTVMELIDAYAADPSPELKDRIKNEVYKLQAEIAELRRRLLDGK